MLARINTNMHSPERPSRRPHGPRAACSPKSGSMTSAKRTHFADIWKAKAGPSMIRTTPPQISLPHDADVEQDPLFNLAPEPHLALKPRRYRLKLLEIDPMSASSDEESPFDTLFSFTASPVDSPSYAATTFNPRQPSRLAPSPSPSPSPLSPQSPFLSPIGPTIVIEQYGDADSVDRWMWGGGREPLLTPMVVDHRAPEFWHDAVAQSDWREVVDRFLQHAEYDDSLFPPTPAPGATFPR
ncbi:hypothetical protein GSI_05629 [Ganoderma sinense ZZ0214-1]|uniref:Uncharacterized protein n=1 Tax=Ganoderma sinense ZZ0214-1 TaxID=1077348 RepID=A0A2G8SF50_9APHY|nr:hypothetical protein GSI_05629 [Ganoderma sinense ZZ0214-1]